MRKAQARTIVPKGNSVPFTRLLSEEEISEDRVSAIIARRANFESVPDKLTGDKLCSINWYYPGGREAFPYKPDCRYVSRYYPNAKGGPLAIDTPNTPEELELSKLKVPHLEKAGVQFYIIDKKKTLEEMLFELGRDMK